MSDTNTESLEKFSYDDDIVRKFLGVTLLWGVVGMLVGIVVALDLCLPQINLAPYLTFGRLRPLHTNAVIFAFAGNAFFCGAYYSTQRVLKTRMWSDLLSRIHFWGWQLIIVAAAITLPLGMTSGKEYAELIWPIDIAIAVVWVAFAVNFFATLAVRRERHLYVALWFYIASIVTVAILHIFNSLALPASLTKGYSIYSGAQDAFMQWWYGHNAVAFFLTTPFLGLMYYFLPKAAGRPVYSYRLSILHFWSLVFLYIWAGPHHLQFSAIPAWASTLGMIFSVMLWMPSWGGMINGLLTLRGAWNKVAEDVVLKFFVVAITFYGMATFEGPMLSILSVNGLAHFTNWIIAHVHAGGLGWNGFLTFGMIYWLAPRIFQTQIWSKRLAEAHFWLGTIGILLYVVSMYSAGVTEGLMWRAFDNTGLLKHPDFVESIVAIKPMYWVRALGGTMYLSGAIACAFNLFKTWQSRPATYDVPVHEAAALASRPVAHEPVPAVAGSGLRKAWNLVHDAPFHRRWEGMPLLFTVLTVLAVVVASLFEILPTFLIEANVPKIASVRPYTPLELGGRDIYIREGCYTCHSQMVRPMQAEIERYGEYSKAGEYVYEHPFQWGSRRIGPDLWRVGGKYPDLWHVRHFQDPQAMAPQSLMPKYSHLFTDSIDYDGIGKTVGVMVKLGVPYSDQERHDAVAMARAQSAEVAQSVKDQGGPALDDKEVIALIAYVQRLGTDIRKSPAAPGSPATVAQGGK